MIKKLIDKIGKTGTVLIGLLTLITLIFGCWQIYKSTTCHNLAGVWKLKFVIESSTYKAYVGESHTQKVFFSQNEFVVTGNGEKWEYNDKFLPYEQHRKLEYNGIIEDDCLKATYKMYGLKRESTGIINVVLIDDGKKMTGTFCGTAADSKGIVTGEKLNE